jgi:hypothetical protein
MHEVREIVELVARNRNKTRGQADKVPLVMISRHNCVRVCSGYALIALSEDS